MSFRIHIIAGARPNFMKIAPLWHVVSNQNWCEPKIVHTGQHYDAAMSDAFFQDLGLPKPHFALNVGSGSHAVQTAKVMIAYEQVCLTETPDLVIVVGDVNSTIAAALVAKKLGYPLAHLEAGLRSGDRSMPEEINRLATDAISDILWTPSADADENLKCEGVASDKIEFVGNIMIDSFEQQRPAIDREAVDYVQFPSGEYAVVTLHRPANVDDESSLRTIIEKLLQAKERLPLVFPMHPRTRGNLLKFGLMSLLEQEGIQILDPLPYRAFMSVVKNCRLVITDSGGIQEETSYLGIPCLTLRENTERPITLTQGTNKLVNAENLIAMLDSSLQRVGAEQPVIDLWDGKTALRIAEKIRQRFAL